MSAWQRAREAEDAQRTGDPGAEAQGRDGRAAEARAAREEDLAGRLLQQLGEHRAVVVAPVPAPCVLVAVALKPLVRDAVMSGTDAVFEEAEEPVDGLRVNLAWTYTLAECLIRRCPLYSRPRRS